MTQASPGVQKQIQRIVTITVDDKMNCTGQNSTNCYGCMSPVNAKTLRYQKLAEGIAKERTRGKIRIRRRGQSIGLTTFVYRCDFVYELCQGSKSS